MWLLEQSVFDYLQSMMLAGIQPTAEQHALFAARSQSLNSDGTPKILTVNNGIATIQVKGVITESFDIFAFLFGGGNTTYGEIISALEAARGDSRVKEAEFDIDSPGGSVAGLFDTLAAAQDFDKPLRAVVRNTAASAAYALASQAQEIIVTNAASMVGSIGVAASFRISPNVVTLTSTAAPKKRPDVSTAQGQADVVEELDALHELFADAIATGRQRATSKPVTIETVNTTYGQGATLVASQALAKGMIDGIKPKLTSVQTPTARGGILKESKTMTLEELKAQFPALYKAAVDEGVNQERDRVTAHLVMGEQAGALDIATKAIKEGQGMTMTLQSEYMAAGMNKRDMDSRDEDDRDNNPGSPEAQKDKDKAASARILSGVAEKMGLELEESDR